MEPKDILHTIVETEHEARRVYGDAVSLQNSFEDYIREHVEKLRDERFQMAEREIDAARKREDARANKAISEMDRQLETELAAARKEYESRKEEYVQKIFNLAVSTNA